MSKQHPSVTATRSAKIGGSAARTEPGDVLLVEDSPTDAFMIREILSQLQVQHRLHVVEDGIEALGFLRREGAYRDAPRPDLILLDLQLPRKSGREVLTEIKADESLRLIPVVVLSSSRADADIVAAYRGFANSYVSKPIDYDEFAEALRLIERFWLGLAIRVRE